MIRGGNVPPGPARLRPNKFGKEHVLPFFTKGPSLGEGRDTYNMFQCKTELLTGRKCISTIKNKTFNGAPATAGLFKIGTNAGFSNLSNHTSSCCSEWREIWVNSKNDGPLVQFVTCDAKSRTIYGWIDLILSEKLPFSYVSKEKARKYSNLSPISRNTLMKYLDQLSFDCEGVLIAKVPNRFGIIFDGWDDGNSTNYLGIFVTFYDEKLEKDVTYLLRLSPLLRRDDYTADSHIETIGYWLENIEKSWDNVVVIMGDNCSTNISIAHKASKPFVGCYSHRLQLAVEIFLAQYSDVIKKIKILAAALCTKKRVGRLRIGKTPYVLYNLIKFIFKFLIFPFNLNSFLSCKMAACINQ